MNTKLIRILGAAAVAGSTAWTALAEKVNFNEMPRAAQKTVRAQAGGAQIEDIDLNTKDGVTFYEVAFKRDGEHIELRVAPDGSVLNKDAEKPFRVSRTAKGENVELTDLPALVRSTIAREAPRVPVSEVERDQATIYDIVAHHKGSAELLRVMEDGTVVQDKRNEALLPEPTTSLSDATKVGFRETPPVVQQMIRMYAGRQPEIEDLDKGKVDGVTVYQAAFKRDNRHFELQVTEDGIVLNGLPPEHFRNAVHRSQNVHLHQTPRPVLETLRDKYGSDLRVANVNERRLPVYEVTFQPGSRVQSMLVMEDGTFVMERAGQAQQGQAQQRLSGRGEQVEFSQLPVAVQNTALKQVGDRPISSIQRLTSGGEARYHIHFDQGGHDASLLVSENGSVLRSTQDYRSEGYIVPMSNARSVAFDRIPTSVQRTIRQHAGAASIDEVKQGTYEGQRIYQASFQRGDDLVQVQVGADGRLLRMGAGAAVR